MTSFKHTPELGLAILTNNEFTARERAIARHFFEGIRAELGLVNEVLPQPRGLKTVHRPALFDPVQATMTIDPRAWIKPKLRSPSLLELVAIPIVPIYSRGEWRRWRAEWKRHVVAASALSKALKIRTKTAETNAEREEAQSRLERCRLAIGNLHILLAQAKAHKLELMKALNEVA